MALHNEIGTLGEVVACEFLQGKGHIVLDRNFRRPYGEIDVVSRGKDGKIHFVEVKSVSWETDYKPEENVHGEKIKRLKRIIETYRSFKRIKGDWQFDVIAVYLNTSTKEAKIRYLDDVILN